MRDKHPNIIDLPQSNFITIKVQRKIHHKVKKMAEIRGMKVGKIIEFALIEYLDIYEDGRFI